MTWLLALLKGIFYTWLGFKRSTAENLGKSEEDDDILRTALKNSNRRAQAIADAPTDKEQLIDQIKSGKVCLLLLIPLLTNCASNNVSIDCDKFRTWTQPELNNLAASLDFVPPNSPIITMGDEWASLRAQAKSCAGE